jgi:hypothetical protein
MKNLLYKEFRLVLRPWMYLMAVLTSALLLIPQWVFFIAMMYFFFITMPNLIQSARASNDISFSVMLPVRKRDVVKSRVLSIVLLEVIQVGTAVPFAVLHGALYTEANFLMNLNVAFFGMTLVMYGLFNVIFFPIFYKTAYKIAAPILPATLVAVLFAVVAETLAALIPALNGTDCASLVGQLPVLAAGIAVFALLTFFAYRLSAGRFETVDV